MTTTTTRTGAEGVRWDLSLITPDAASARQLLDNTLAGCDAFQATYRGRVASFDPDMLVTALAELARIDNALSRVGSYAGLRRATDVNDDEARDLEAVVEQGFVRASNTLRFFELEWIMLDDQPAGALASAPAVARDAHWLRSARRYRPHRLSEAEERMWAERSPSADNAWQSLFEQTVANITVDFDAGDGPRPHTHDELLAYLYSADRGLRLRALDAVYGSLDPLKSVLAHCYDALVADRLVDDRLRNYQTPMAQRHLANELPDAAVDAMLDAIESRYATAQRWYTHKARLLGLERLHLCDQYAPLKEGRFFTFDEAQAVVREGLAAFSPRIADIADAFFTEHRVDAEPHAGKRGGAFCASVAQDAKPFILLNYTGRLRDVTTTAHELGHGMHFALAQAAQTALSAQPGVALAEVPSTFAEMVVVDHLLRAEADAETRAALLRQQVEMSFATVFRQTMMARYEQDAYGLRGDGRALTAERLGDVWWQRNQRQYGDAVELPAGYRLGWSYIPHFINTRFYTYAYAFAHLTSLVLYAAWRAEPDRFVDNYLAFLATGGAASPAEQLARFGIDITNRATWLSGLDQLDAMVDRAIDTASEPAG